MDTRYWKYNGGRLLDGTQAGCCTAPEGHLVHICAQAFLGCDQQGQSMSGQDAHQDSVVTQRTGIYALASQLLYFSAHGRWELHGLLVQLDVELRALLLHWQPCLQ